MQSHSEQGAPIATLRSPPGRVEGTPPARTLFSRAHDFGIGSFHYVDAQHAAHVTVHSPPYAASFDGWDLLLKHTARNALHNSRARSDAPKCDEDTRVEVANAIMTFIENHEGPQRLLCMTGAAGSGKSALQQTIAEICLGKNSLASSFFFSAGDPDRNTINPVVPTIAYQLGRSSAAVKRLIKTAVEEDPLIFDQHLYAQMTTLIVKPLEHLRDTGLDLSTLPYAILIDGIDDCMGEDPQVDLLAAIKDCLLVDHLPFRVFISSRPEWAIRSALEPGGDLHAIAHHIRLSDDYDASADMRRYLRRRFQTLSLRIRDPNWFHESDIETLVRAASGQFIYVATAFKFISERLASPADRLKIVSNWTPDENQTARPFVVLDQLYINILRSAKNAYEQTHHGRDFLLLLRTYNIVVDGLSAKSFQDVRFSADILSVLLGLEARAEENLVSDLHSLVALERDSRLQICLYHVFAYGRTLQGVVCGTSFSVHLTLTLYQMNGQSSHSQSFVNVV
ncbi:hypothetical protein EST38_g7438 [Candolleomyces aberdarensis]|uniref:Nephrocystin 3-like N-terminal domain-containing protein n=1 Tax=Candolleomyces aberdarensis TaxID=2316362 RepID=A0A4Q2DF82_9AGAR|nr:hypothetical protein EST38_g7438 [Candolleomyces aberdarensis]